MDAGSEIGWQFALQAAARYVSFQYNLQEWLLTLLTGQEVILSF